jgi:hypothetical protein
MTVTPNPYEPPVEIVLERRPPRPVGTVLLALFLFLFGVLLGGGWVQRLVQVWSMDPSPWDIRDYLASALLGIVALVAIATGIGLLIGGRWSWWLAIAADYLGLATFVLVPIVNSGLGYRVISRLVFVVLLVAFWCYLQRRNVKTFFGQPADQQWRFHPLVRLELRGKDRPLSTARNATPGG